MRRDSYVFINGEFLPSRDAKLSIWDRGLLYGDGFFTTMRAEKGKAFFLREHIRRLKDSCELFSIKFPDQLSQKDLYGEMLDINNLSDNCAAVKVIITRGVVEGPGLPSTENPTYIITARPYESPNEKYQTGWHLVSFNISRSCPLSAHKSLNYLFNMWAKGYALSQGADDAILIGFDGHVKETSVANILFQKEGTWFRPEGEDILPGITLKMLSKIWDKKGIGIRKKLTSIKDLIEADQVWVLNSLMGIMPVIKINDRRIKSEEGWDFADLSREWLWDYAMQDGF